VDEAADDPLAGLTPEEREKLRARAAQKQPRAHEGLSKEFGVTRERIREIESKTLAKLGLGRRGGGADATGVREPQRPVEPSLGPGHALEQPSE
jgi:hypothetical protein